jgi:hypothetical protein
MPDYTDPYITLRREEREIKAVTGKAFRFFYERDKKGVTRLVVYTSTNSGLRKLTAFDDRDSAIEYAKIMAGYFNNSLHNDASQG